MRPDTLAIVSSEMAFGGWPLPDDEICNPRSLPLTRYPINFLVILPGDFFRNLDTENKGAATRALANSQGRRGSTSSDQADRRGPLGGVVSAGAL